jgi:F-box/leucine-rich repeat protein 2/20
VNPNLLHLTCNGHISNEAVIVLARRCSQLRSFEGMFPLLNDDALCALATGCPHLANVELSMNSITHVGLHALAQARALTQLAMPHMPFEQLKLCPALRKLDLRTPVDVESVLWTVGAYCPHLVDVTVESLRVDRNRCYRQVVTTMVKCCRQLQRILLNINATDGVLTAIAQHCPHLTILELILRCTATDIGLASLAQGCPKLSQLGLRLCAPITLGGIEALATHCPRLRFVEASKSVMKADGWGRLGCKLKVKMLTVRGYNEIL